MSSLDKLGIRGIRAFDSNELNVIQFFHPLTVIVGHNGSGKTTIIECLKYATTGDMPPNTKGGAFIHDPNMAGETEVKAEVKLRFINTNGDKMTATRRLQVTKKKTTLSMKTLEGTIAYDDKDLDSKKRRSLSTRCSDMDEELPRLLGVSKSILENVIFCHQEESNWPLSEPSVLKKKFDDIFEATKYTKALDQIKSIRKEQAIELKVDRERLIALKNDKDRAAKLENSISKLEREVAVKTAQSETLADQVKDCTEHNKQFYTMAVEHDRILSEVKALDTEKRITDSTIQDLRNTITELPGTKAELQAQRDNFSAQAQEKQQRKRGYKRDLEEAEEEHIRLGKLLQRQNTERGTLQAEENAFQRALDDRQSTVTSLASQHEIRGFDIDPLEERQIDEFRERLSGEMQKRKREYDEVRETGKESEREKRSAIYTIETQQKSNQASRADLRRQQDRYSQKIDEYTVQIDSARSSESDVAMHKQTIQEQETRQKNLTEELKKEDFDNKVRAKKGELREAENKRDGLHTELAGLNRQADTRAKLAIKKAEIKKKEDSVSNTIEINADSYKQHIKQDPEKERMLDAVKNEISRATSEMTRAEKAALSTQRELTQIESSVSLLKQQTASAEKEIKEIDLQIAEETENQDLATAISDAEEEIRVRTESIEQLKSGVAFFQRVLKTGRDKHTCLACARGLADDEMAKFEQYCKKQMETTPDKIKQEEADLPEWRQILSSLRKLEPLHATAIKLRETDLPKFSADLERANARLANAVRKSEEASAKVSELKTTSRELEALKAVAMDVARMVNEVRDLSRDVQNLERQLESSGSARTADDVQAELETLSSDINRLKKEIDQLQRDKETMNERIRACESAVGYATLKLKDAQQKVDLRASAQAQKADAEAQKAELQATMEGYDKQLQEAEPLLQRAKKELRDFLDKQSERETEAQVNSEALVKGLDELDRAMKSVKNFRHRDTKARLRRCEEEIKGLDGRIRAQDEKMGEFREAVSRIEKEEHDSKNLERNVNDNIRYRDLKERIKQLERDIEGKDLEGANKAKRQFDKDYNASMKRLEELQRDHARTGGELAQSEKSLADKREELESEYKTVRVDYTKQLIKVKTTDFAIQDLEKYGKALDNAIMKYHGHKMAEINDTAQALWNKCYQGTDIDTIKISSDSDGATTKVGNRSYNYRVVMVKDQVEMDMRGRCSAGQKVLASIIIRLALAESFGTNCGILALDEPTTNLDRDNIAALSTALADIIKERRSQANFQLIVITHDEEFLTNLGTSGALEKYWRVSRNVKQKSTIERQRLDQH